MAVKFQGGRAVPVASGHGLKVRLALTQAMKYSAQMQRQLETIEAEVRAANNSAANMDDQRQQAFEQDHIRFSLKVIEEMKQLAARLTGSLSRAPNR